MIKQITKTQRAKLGEMRKSIKNTNKSFIITILSQI